ncbi:hypothetical protein OU682_20640 [Paracoccus sp. EF6]|uniref:DDE superfamily endonuclease n=2 Tax=Paracoccus benzoatiresistens TaxID=2997341 RepID=A0ABT4JA97_9RHOB|nr:hypothetical protein [Paracoccus sp. EF6]MCZ0964004.1 hypothetical protein [Paracoccus sp. EF6]
MTLPPYAPELNPVENIWAYLRANRLAISVFDTYDDIVDRCCDAWNAFANDPERVRSIATGSDDVTAPLCGSLQTHPGTSDAVGGRSHHQSRLNHMEMAGAERLWAIVGLVVAASVLKHGLTVTPIMRLLDCKQGRDRDAPAMFPPACRVRGKGVIRPVLPASTTCGASRDRVTARCQDGNALHVLLELYAGRPA